MFVYEKKLQYPVKIKNPNPALAKVIISQLGGPHGELGAATRYLSQRFAMPDRKIIEEQIRNGGFDAYFVDHTAGIYPQAASGVPFSASTLASTGDVFADLHEDLAAEQKARVTYENILRLTDDPDVREPIKFLRQREINHYQRFAESLGIAQDAYKDKKNFYYYNPAFDRVK